MNILMKSKKLLAICLVVIMAMGFTITSLAAQQRVEVYSTTEQNARPTLFINATKNGYVDIALQSFPYPTYNIGFKASNGETGFLTRIDKDTPARLINLKAGVTYEIRFSTYDLKSGFWNGNVIYTVY